MFTSSKDFMGKVYAGKFNEALAMLKSADGKNYHPEAFKAIKTVDPQTKATLLHQLAESVLLNDALKDISEEKTAKQQKADATELLQLVIAHSDRSAQRKADKRTDTMVAIDAGHSAILAALYVGTMLDLVDSEGNTVLHYAINQAEHKLIQQILKADSKAGYSLYFKKNDKGLFSFALAMRNYQDRPTDVTISLVNQLYFALPSGQYRTKAVETEMPVTWGWLSKPLWQNALYLCGKRDANGNVVGYELNMWDFVEQVVKDSLYVWGLHVDLPLIYEYSKHYSGTPGEILQQANALCGLDLRGRTVTQAKANPTLAQNTEYMQRARLENANYYLIHMDAKNEGKLETILFPHDKDFIILCNDRLYYLPQHDPKTPAIVKEIQKEGGASKDQKEHVSKAQVAYEVIKTAASQITTMNQWRKADLNEIQHILPIIPLVWGLKSVAAVGMGAVKKGRLSGMTTVSKSVMGLKYSGGLYQPKPAGNTASAAAPATPPAAGAGAGAGDNKPDSKRLGK